MHEQTSEEGSRADVSFLPVGSLGGKGVERTIHCPESVGIAVILAVTQLTAVGFFAGMAILMRSVVAGIVLTVKGPLDS